MTSRMPFQGQKAPVTFTRRRVLRAAPTAVICLGYPPPDAGACRDRRPRHYWRRRVHDGRGAPVGAGAVANRGDRLVAVGTEPNVEGAVPEREAACPHLPGRMVLPAFQDSHLHAPFAGRYRLHVSLHDLPGVDAYRDAVAVYAREHPDEPSIFGGGWLMSHFPGGTPTKGLLDDIVPDRPVFLLNRDVHGAWGELQSVGGRTHHARHARPVGRADRA